MSLVLTSGGGSDGKVIDFLRARTATVTATPLDVVVFSPCWVTRTPTAPGAQLEASSRVNVVRNLRESDMHAKFYEMYYTTMICCLRELKLSS